MNRRALLVLAALFSLVFVVIIGCGGGGSKSTNPGGGGPSFNLTFPATGTSRSFTFPTDGSWAYHCTPHASSGMQGTVVVNSSSMNDSALVTVGPSNSLTFSPATVTIKTGGTVRWVNASSMTNHTVTRP
jgi:plastocyanin